MNSQILHFETNLNRSLCGNSLTFHKVCLHMVKGEVFIKGLQNIKHLLKIRNLTFSIQSEEYMCIYMYWLTFLVMEFLGREGERWKLFEYWIRLKQSSSREIVLYFCYRKRKHFAKSLLKVPIPLGCLLDSGLFCVRIELLG